MPKPFISTLFCISHPFFQFCQTSPLRAFQYEEWRANTWVWTNSFLNSVDTNFIITNNPIKNSPYHYLVAGSSNTLIMCTRCFQNLAKQVSHLLCANCTLSLLSRLVLCLGCCNHVLSAKKVVFITHCQCMNYILCTCMHTEHISGALHRIRGDICISTTRNNCTAQKTAWTHVLPLT